LLNWFMYGLYAWIFCLPLICSSALGPSTEKVVNFLWQLVASYFAYRLVVNQWIKETRSENQVDGENPIPTA